MFACFPRLNWDVLVWVAVSPLIVSLVREPKLTQGFLFAYLSGAVFLSGSCYWFVEVMETYGKLQPALAVGVLVLFVVVFAGFFGVFGVVLTWVARRSLPTALLLGPFLWVSMELARTYLITGFPWNLLGYAVQASGLRQLASVTAVYGLSFVAVTTSALAAAVFLQPRQERLWVALGLWTALLVAADLVLVPPPVRPGTHSAYLVQPDVPLDEGTLEAWLPSRNPAPLKRLVTMTLANTAGVHDFSAPPLIVWAENPAPFYFDRDPVFQAAAQEMARRGRAYVILNTVTFAAQDNSQPRNSAIVLDPDGRDLFQYDKIHLVPFGEYVPWWAFPGKVGKITSEVGDFVSGSAYRVADTTEGKIGVFICYEAIFPQLVRRLVAAGAEVLVNISNDAWFGDSPAAFQHLEMARLRAVENRRFLLRATNDGITAVIDPYGRVVAQLPRHRAMVLAGRFDYIPRRTFYTAHGDLFAWLCAIVSAVLVGTEIAARKGKSQVRSEKSELTEDCELK